MILPRFIISQFEKLLMKAIAFLFIVLFLFVPFIGFSQINEDALENFPTYLEYKKMSKYETWIKLNNKKSIKGYLYQISNHEISLLPSKTNDYSDFQKFVAENQTVIEIPNIRKIKTRKKGKLRKGILIGLGIGLVPGLVIGPLQADSEFAVDTVPLTFTTTILGGLIGAMIGGKKEKHNLSEREKLERLKKKGISIVF